MPYQVGLLRPALWIEDELIKGNMNVEMQSGRSMLLMLLFGIYRTTDMFWLADLVITTTAYFSYRNTCTLMIQR